MSLRNENRIDLSQQTITTPPDKTLILVSVFIVVIGIMSVFSAGSARAIRENITPLYYVLRHLIGFLIGVVACSFIIFKFDYKKLKNLALPFAFFVLFLLILTAFTPLGYTAGGATRWLNFGGGIRFQPSEFAKLAVVLCFANIFSKDIRILDSNKYIYYFLFGLILLLVLKQPNLSMALLLLMTTFGIYFCAGGSIKFILSSVICAIPVGFLYLRGYQWDRILTWLNPDRDPRGTGYNIIQSLIAFAEGGLIGVGYGNSKQKLSWLPEGHTDFIFSVIAEEFGFIGSVFIVILFLVFIMRGFLIATRCPDMFGKLLAFGITFSIGTQALLNMAVASSFIPATGIPMPFISYGSSSLVVTMCMLGILLNISRKKVRRIMPNGVN